MNMGALDWAILVGFFLALIAIAWLSSRLTTSVADFLAANRSAGRYLLTIAQGMSGLGAISIAANFEKYYQAGFGAMWWVQILAPLSLILALSGFVIYRFRETRALTMAQFFEMRYSRRFRIFSGVLAWLSGILNYGIFPAVTARFIVYFTGLPTEVSIAGWSVATTVPVMIVLLGTAFVMASVGGQVSIMITDFFQGQFVNIVMLIILGVLFYYMSWPEVIEGLRHAPEGQSRINPFKQGELADFNVWFFIILGVLQIYGYKAWQGSQGYNAAAKTPHEAKMATILGEFRGMITLLMLLLVPIFIFAYLHLPQFASTAEHVTLIVGQIPDAQIQKQMLVPTALGSILPAGVMGLFASVIIAASIATDSTYMHSWGSIFVQDVILPFRKTRLSPRAHLWLLRGAIFSVAGFAFVWSILFPLNEYIFMYFQITGAIYLGGAGAVILGGLYWPRGSTGGAWAAMIVGSALAVVGIVLRNVIWPALPRFREMYPEWETWMFLPEQFPLNGAQMSFVAAVAAIGAYISVSLLSRKPPADLNKILHRGSHAVDGEHIGGEPDRVSARHLLKIRPAASWRERLGIGPEFTRSDRVIYYLKIGWVMFFVVVFVVGTVVNLIWPFSDSAWEIWWGFKVFITIAAGIAATIWFLIGGFRDLLELIRELRKARCDVADDGTVAPTSEQEQEHL